MVVILEYCNDVISGKEAAGQLLKLSCNRFVKDLERDDIYFDEKYFTQIVVFFSLLRHWQGKWAGTPIVLTPFQKFMIGGLMCFRWTDTKKRKIKSCYIQVARKNTKTILMSGLSLFHIMLDEEPAAEVFVGANNHDQAQICTNCCGKLCKSSPFLRELLRDKRLTLYAYKDNISKIVFQTKNKYGTIQSMSKQADTKDGFSPSLGIIDEYHEAQTDKLINVIESGQGARDEPMLFCITTAGFNKAGPCYSILRDQSIKQLREVISDESHYSLICEPDANDSWEDESTWKKANPMISDVDTILPYLTDRFTRAKNAGGTKEIDFKTKNLNQWTDAPETWLQDSVWMEGNGAPKNMGQKFFAGIDLAHVADMSALVFIGEEDDGGVMDIFTDVWIPGESILEKMKEDKNSQYVNWIKEGFLNHIEQRVTDDREIEERFFLRAKEMDVVSLGYDPKFASGFVSRLSERGVDCWEVPQSYAQMTEAIAFLEQKAIDGKLRHGGHPVLSWHCRNTILRRNRGGEMILDKSEAHRKIDCMVALTLAMKQYQTWKKEAEANVEIFFV